MHEVRISVETDGDLDLIAAYTTETWGSRQTDRYLAKLEDGFNLLAGNPSIGRSCDAIRPGLHRFEIGKHVVFYIPEQNGVLIVRTLHQQMIPAKRHFEP
jgi:toxin ParE1/3/4